LAERFAIVGYGNIGQRHTDSLQTLGIKEIVLIRRDPAAPVLDRHDAMERAGSLEEALHSPLAGVVIATPTSLHGRDIETCLHNGIPMLLEKPIVADWAEAIRLVAIFADTPAPVLVGFDLRFTPPVNAIKEQIAHARLGEIRLAQLDAGGYLPDWRPHLDYREVFSSSRALGGGVTLDLVHEIDSMLYFFGKPDSVMATIARKGTLEIDSDDVSAMTFDYDRGPVVSIVLDYLRRPYRRSYTIVGDDATLNWVEGDGEVTVVRGGSGKKDVIWSAAPDARSPFVEEMAHFLRVARGKTTPKVDFWEGMSSLGLVEAARRSAANGHRESTAPFLKFSKPRK
jgi:predicted dehydrogenase